MALLRMEKLWYQYTLTKNPVLRDVNLTVEKGEFLILLGPSGCGKSTLALLVNGVIPNQLGGKISGKVEVDGMDTMQHSIGELARNVGIVFQNPEAGIIHLVVEDEVAFPMQNLLVQPDVMRERVDEMLDLVGLKKFKKSLTNSLSGGQKQRLAIATALAMHPKILILDEPTVHLDPKGAREVIAIIEKLNREEDVAIILIEHKLDDVMQLADRIAVMNEGTIIATEEPQKLTVKKASYIMNDLGLFIPQVTEIACDAATKGYRFDNVPITVQDFPSDIMLRKMNRFTNHNQENTYSNNVIEVKDVSFQYPNGTEALTKISMNVKQGEVYALLGSNGSGKTTLAKILIGLLKPTGGQVLIKTDDATYDVSTTSPKVLSRFIGFSFQNPENQFVTERVYDDVAFGLKILKNLSEDEIENRTMNMLEQFGLKDYVNEHPLNLSMGQKRRLSVATMLILEPKMIIFDEPMTGQDKRRTDFIIQLMFDLKNKGTTAIFITHDMNFVANVASRVGVINDGQLIFQGTPEELFNSPDILKQGSLEDPMVHRLAIKLNPQHSSVINVKDFCNLLVLNY